MNRAAFDRHDHPQRPGWATYHKHLTGWHRLVCAVLGHAAMPDPVPPDGHSTSNYARCRNCGAWLKWYVTGQHRYGSVTQAVR